MCTLTATGELLKHEHPSVRLANDPTVPGQVGFGNRGNVLAGPENGWCDFAVAPLQTFELEWSEGLHCSMQPIGRQVVNIEIGMPVSSGASRSIALLVRELKADLEWGDIIDKHRKISATSICSLEQEDDHGEAYVMKPADALGAVIVCFIFALAGISGSIFRWWVKHHQLDQAVITASTKGVNVIDERVNRLGNALNESMRQTVQMSVDACARTAPATNPASSTSPTGFRLDLRDVEDPATCQVLRRGESGETNTDDTAVENLTFWG